MKHLLDFINENLVCEKKFSGEDFYKHDYSRSVIAQLMTGQPIKIGETGDKSIQLDPEMKNEFCRELSQAGAAITLDEFNDIMKRYNMPIWTGIFKGEFSGYTNGIASKNKGNAFENEYIENFANYQAGLEKTLGMNPGELDNCTLQALGNKNTKRPLVVKNGSIVLGGSNVTIGSDVVDVLLTTANGDEYNLSLKFGERVTFCNCGVQKIFTKQSFEKYKKTGEYEPENMGDVSGEDLLELFGIDENKFAEVFTGYIEGKKVKGEKDIVDITNDLSKSKNFMKFVESVVGYDYILVHKIKNEVHNIDLRTPADTHKLIGKIKKAQILYPKSGSAKRIDIAVEFTNIKILFNIRSKQGGVYPTHILADYTIDKNY